MIFLSTHIFQHRREETQRDEMVQLITQMQEHREFRSTIERCVLFPSTLLRRQKKARLLIRASTTNQKFFSGENTSLACFLCLDKDCVYVTHGCVQHAMGTCVRVYDIHLYMRICMCCSTSGTVYIHIFAKRSRVVMIERKRSIESQDSPVADSV